MCGGYILAYAETTTAAMCARRREISSSINTTHCEEAKRFVRAWRKPLPTQGDESLERIDLENLEKKRENIKKKKINKNILRNKMEESSEASPVKESGGIPLVYKSGRVGQRYSISFPLLFA